METPDAPELRALVLHEMGHRAHGMPFPASKGDIATLAALIVCAAGMIAYVGAPLLAIIGAACLLAVLPPAATATRWGAEYRADAFAATHSDLGTVRQMLARLVFLEAEAAKTMPPQQYRRLRRRDLRTHPPTTRRLQRILGTTQ